MARPKAEASETKKLSLLDRLRKNSTIKTTETLSESIYFQPRPLITTVVPALNIALSGRIDGGLGSGTTMLAGPSKNFKSGILLLLAHTALEQFGKEGALLFYNNEFGTPLSYFDSYGIPRDQVIHTPIFDIEQLKHDMMTQLAGIERGDPVIMAVDSIGNLASRKEFEDALKSDAPPADMTRAKALKSLFRLITPHLAMKQIPLVIINHTYKTIEKFSKDQVSGGTGGYYGADNILVINRSQDAEGEGADRVLNGFKFNMKVEKSRFIREGVKIPLNVGFKTGIDRYSGLFEMAIESGHIISEKQGWYQRVDMDTGEILDEKGRRKSDATEADFWEPILKTKTFPKWVEDTYSLGAKDLLSQEENEVEEVLELADDKE